MNKIKLEKPHYIVSINKEEMARRFEAREFGKEIDVSASSVFKYELVPHLAEWFEERETAYKLVRGYDEKTDALGMDLLIDDIAVAIEFKLTWQ